MPSRLADSCWVKTYKIGFKYLLCKKKKKTQGYKTWTGEGNRCFRKKVVASERVHVSSNGEGQKEYCFERFGDCVDLVTAYAKLGRVIWRFYGPRWSWSQGRQINWLPNPALCVNVRQRLMLCLCPSDVEAQRQAFSLKATKNSIGMFTSSDIKMNLKGV